MSKLSDLLGADKYKQPGEISKIKLFVRDKFDEDVGVEITKNTIVISVNSASLASALRYKIIELEQILKTDRKLVIRIE